MADLKKFSVLVLSLLLTAFWALFPNSVFALNNKYYDFGPYYGREQVLGFSFSNLEKLPVPQIPSEITPPPATGILPGSIFYPFEKTFENITLTFTFNPVKKEELRLNIASERLSEAKTLMEKGQTTAASQALDDYSQTLTTLSQNLTSLAQKADAASQELIKKVEQTAASQTVVATSLSLSSSPVQAEAWTQAAQTNKSLTDEIAQISGKPAVPEEISTTIQKLKEDGLISEEESNKIYGFNQRSQVRDEIDKLTSSGQFPLSEAAKMDEAVQLNFPDSYKQYLTNLQVVELKSYQSLPQPDTKALEELKKWQDNPSIPPSNDIKPYLWYNRAQDLAKGVDLSNFSQTQQTELIKFYPQAVSDNSTYVPPPSPSPTDDTLASPTPSITPSSPIPTPSAAPATEPYLVNTGGALPGNPTYFISQLGEGLTYALTFDPAEKAKLRMQQAERRLAEASSLSADPKKAALYESALKNYQSTMADTSKYIKELKDPKIAEKAAERLEAQAARHEVVLEKGLLPAPNNNPKLITEVIKATEDAMDVSADALDRPALPPALSQRLGDLKAQGLILDEEAQDLIGSNSREEVRSKIRKLTELNTFPLADAKKLDEAQTFTSPSDFNQLTEVRKITELQALRSVQSDLAQTPSLKQTVTALDQQKTALENSFDPTAIKPEDLGGRDDLAKTYQKLASTARPINLGQFGTDVTGETQPSPSPSASPSPTPKRQDAVLTTCPEGATFKQFEGCVWADSGRSLNDYEQYKCQGPRQYYSFAAKKCVPYESGQGFRDDAQPICPVGYSWSWQTQSCQTSAGGIIPLPTPQPQPEPIDEKDIEERSKSCPVGSSYKPPQGCVWEKDGKPVYDPERYRCGRDQYYSFEQQKCVPSPKAGDLDRKDYRPVCKDENTYWSWDYGKCIQPTPIILPQDETGSLNPIIIDDIKPTFVAPGNPFYFLKQAAERAQLALTFTAPARERVSLAQAKERLAEAADALRKDDKQNFKKALSKYTEMMQDIVADVSKDALTEGAKKEIGDSLSKGSVEQNLLLQKLSAWAPPEQDTDINAATSATILGVDKAADFAGEPALPAEVKAKIETLPENMISEEDKKKLLEAKSRVEVRLTIGGLLTNGGLDSTDTAFLNDDFTSVDREAKIKIEELKKLEQIAEAADKKDKIEQNIEKNEKIVEGLAEFEKTFKAGEDIPANVRPWVRLTRIDEVTQTIRPDIVNLNDFQNRKDLVLAVATLQQEFRPTRDSFQQIEQFRKRFPNAPLPPELARIEALSYSLGIREQAGPCFLPNPPFPANTPCPAPGAAIPIVSNYSTSANYYGTGYNPSQTTPTPSYDKDGNSLVYGQGPKAENAGVCPSGYHWMYDSGGWCMSNSGSYNSSSYTPTGTGPGYTPYSPYYTAPGAPPASYGYPGGYPPPSSSYIAPSYWGPAPSYYTTTPPSGTVPGSGPKPTAPGQCPQGFHWMSDSGGWCMADGPTYVPSGSQYYPGGTTTSGTPPPGGYNCGSQPFDPATGKCKDGACPGGFNWDGSKCVANNSSYYSPNLNQSSCGPGYYWDGKGCIPTYSGGGYSGSSSYSGSSYCQPPSNGCPSSSYWDYGSCNCRPSGTYYGGSGPSSSNSCQGISCGGGSYLDYSTCSCKYSSYGGTSTGTSNGSYCSPPAGGCGSGWFDSASCSCKQSSSQGCYNVSASSCPSGWYFDSGACTCRQSTTSSGSTTTTGGTTTSGGTTSSGSCPSGYHWMSDNGGWCMQDGSGGSSTPTTTSTPTSSTAPTTTTPTTTEPAPAPPPASSEPAPAPPPASSEPAPAPSGG
ncbi:hypothetical protein HY384_00190 [Candidatus Daviesbacteria bacterium]|nr:hypothetical protein [Candidatus Daviesbacteria bacterium]